MSADDQDVCKAITDMQYNNILGVRIIENLHVITMYAKPKVPLPKPEKFNQMFAQSEILMSIAKSNADFWTYPLSSSETSDVLFFPFTSASNNNNRDRTLVI